MTSKEALSVALAGKLPKGDGNGLAEMAPELEKNRKQIRVAVVLFDVASYAQTTDDGTAEVKVRIRRIEAITDPDDAAAMERLLMRQFERRTGQTVLPIDLEADVEKAFEDLRASMPTIGDGARAWEPGQDPRVRDDDKPPGDVDFRDGDDDSAES